MSTNTNVVSDMIDTFKNEYSSGVIFSKDSLSVFAKDHLRNDGFLGSHNVVFLTCQDSIVQEAPGCIAAPLVNMVALNRLSLGAEGQGSQPVPLRIFTPRQFTLTSKELSVGDVSFLTEPIHGFISCKKLTLIQRTDEEPSSFELIKSWLMDDATEIERIRPE